MKFESTKQTDAGILAEHKKKEREAAKQGKQPFYLKKCISTYLLLSVASFLISILSFFLEHFDLLLSGLLFLIKKESILKHWL